MIKTPSVVVALCAAGLLAGCGGGAKTVTVTTPVPAAAATPPAGTTAPTGASGPTGTTNPSASIKAAAAADPAIARQIAQAVASCKAAVNSQPSLSAANKAKLDAICDKAGTGDTVGVQKQTAAVCQQIVKDTVAPAAQAQALAACPKP
jgi:hypothetical protein